MVSLMAHRRDMRTALRLKASALQARTRVHCYRSLGPLPPPLPLPPSSRMPPSPGRGYFPIQSLRTRALIIITD